MKSGWITRISKGVYKMQGTSPTLMDAVSSYNDQMNKKCVVGAYTALDFRGYSHYLSMGKPKAYLFTDKKSKLPSWLLNEDWNMTVKYMITSFLGEGSLGVETITVDGRNLLVSSPERAIMECLKLPDAASSLLDIYYIMESLTTLRPKLVQRLLESCSSQKVKRLFLYLSEKANHPWFKALKWDSISIGTSRYMVVPTGKYISKYNMTIPKELAEYE
jgi:predicted transcriptional regulator of viral defense system